MSKTLNRVTKTESIAVGEVEGSKWVRIQGKGNFMSSPRLKEYVDGCWSPRTAKKWSSTWKPAPAMDSTFMGDLGRLGQDVCLDREGKLSIVGLSDRNRDSLVDLGLDAIMEMEKRAEGSRTGVRIWKVFADSLKTWEGSEHGAAAAGEVLEAHRKLCEVDDRNQSKFGAVLEVLEEECSASSQRLRAPEDKCDDRARVVDGSRSFADCGFCAELANVLEIGRRNLRDPANKNSPTSMPKNTACSTFFITWESPLQRSARWLIFIEPLWRASRK